ncbi:unnamed protein product [Paramecium primaurelia]|uniref:Uncharacterized protein n=1 Tax=Paramecium primaurelia TaxID=5886 RepID=A0A8S1MQC3_PARPR|nr:unnamed protein product [Paramecium primaurelia]
MQRNISLNNSKQIEIKNKRDIRSKKNDANDIFNKRIIQLYNLKEFIGSVAKNQSFQQQTQDLQNQIQQFNQQTQYQPQLQQEINLLIQGNLDILQQQFDTKTKDFDQLKNDLERYKNRSQQLKEYWVFGKVNIKSQRNILNIFMKQKKTVDLQKQIENKRLEYEKRIIQLKLQAFVRLLKDQEQLETKKQNQESKIYNIKQQLNEKRRIIQYLDLEQDFINFKNQILNLMMKEIRNSRIGKQKFSLRKLYLENELKRLHAIVIQLQQENNELKSRRNQINYNDKQRYKISNNQMLQIKFGINKGNNINNKQTIKFQDNNNKFSNCINNYNNQENNKLIFEIRHLKKKTSTQRNDKILKKIQIN